MTFIISSTEEETEVQKNQGSWQSCTITKWQSQGWPQGLDLQSHDLHSLLVYEVLRATWPELIMPQSLDYWHSSHTAPQSWELPFHLFLWPFHMADPCCARSRMVQPQHCVFHPRTHYSYKLFNSPFYSHKSCSWFHLCPDWPVTSAPLNPRFHILPEAFQQVVPLLSFPMLQIFPTSLYTSSSHTQVSKKSL